MKEDIPKNTMRSLILHATKMYRKHVINVKMDDNGFFHFYTSLLFSII